MFYFHLSLLGHCYLFNCLVFSLFPSSKIQMSFKWNSAAPFQLSPEQGRLKPGQQCVITVDFQPLEAQVYQKQVHCTYGEDGNKANSCCTVLLQGIGTAETKLALGCRRTNMNCCVFSGFFFFFVNYFLWFHCVLDICPVSCVSY